MARRFDVSDEVQDLRNDFSRFRSSVADMLESLIAGGKSGAGELRERVSENAEKWIDELRDVMSTAGTKGRKAIDTVHHQIEDRPVTSLLVAFGIGLAIGKLLDRR